MISWLKEYIKPFFMDIVCAIIGHSYDIVDEEGDHVKFVTMECSRCGIQEHLLEYSCKIKVTKKK